MDYRMQVFHSTGETPYKRHLTFASIVDEFWISASNRLEWISPGPKAHSMPAQANGLGTMAGKPIEG